MRQESLVTKYDYDFENDSIFFYGSNKKYRSSIDLDGITFDISEDNQVMATLRPLTLQIGLTLQKRV